MQEIVEKAYAKVNFGLQVFPKTCDAYNNSYHKILGVFQTIDLYDELIVSVIFPKTSEVSDFKNAMQCSNSEINSLCNVSVESEDCKLPVNNTITKAYLAFCEECISNGKEIPIPSINVKLKKGIPSGGGLGGGSSDAAALVRAMERLCNIELSLEELDKIASKVGSDVFFFMHCDKQGKGCALVSGRGEFIKQITPRNDLYLIVIFPTVSSSTKVAYELVDKMFAEKSIDSIDSDKGTFEMNINDCIVKYQSEFELEKIYSLPVKDWTFTNTFTPVIADFYKEIGLAINELKNVGCCFTEMSGSGSTVFGVFTLKQQADSVRNMLADKWNCKLVRTI